MLNDINNIYNDSNSNYCNNSNCKTDNFKCVDLEFDDLEFDDLEFDDLEFGDLEFDNLEFDDNGAYFVYDNKDIDNFIAINKRNKIIDKLIDGIISEVFVGILIYYIPF